VKFGIYNRGLKTYKVQPGSDQKAALETFFDEIFTQRTRYESLNQLLKRIYKNKAKLLRVLARPEIPLHTNGSETDIRDFVKRERSVEVLAVMLEESAEIHFPV